MPASSDQYSVVRAIGQGGMGSVFEVEHRTLEKHFALKLLSESLRDNDEAIERFRTETLALGKLDHPNIVVAMDAGIWQGRPYLVTELLKGRDLSAGVSEEGKLKVEPVISIALQLVDALGFAHRHGYYHRDIKPSNVFYQPDEKVKLLDFGLVRSEANHGMTQTGCLMGTCDFIAPEQASNAAQAGAASDIYSLGCTLIYLLSGDVPFPDRSFPSLSAKLHAQFHQSPAWLDRPGDGVPRWMLDLIRAMVAKDPIDRPSSCLEIASCLQQRIGPANVHLAANETPFGRLRKVASKKLALRTGLAVSVVASGWVLSLNVRSPKDVASDGLLEEISFSDSTATSQPNPQPSMVERTDARKATEKTLPAMATHNARGIGVPVRLSGPSNQTPHSTKTVVEENRDE